MIWRLRNEGEDEENDILRRVLQDALHRDTSSPIGAQERRSGGVRDARHGVDFDDGFLIFRSYLGTRYEATAGSGVWQFKNDQRSHPSLNALSKAIGAKTENAWRNWYFKDEIGTTRPVSDLRNPKTVANRKAGDTSAHSRREDVALAKELLDHGGSATWADDLVTTLRNLGGKAPLARIYAEVEKIRRSAQRSLPPKLEETVRRTLEDHCSDSDNFRRRDLFCMAEGKGAGVWALR